MNSANISIKNRVNLDLAAPVFTSPGAVRCQHSWHSSGNVPAGFTGYMCTGSTVHWVGASLYTKMERLHRTHNATHRPVCRQPSGTFHPKEVNLGKLEAGVTGIGKEVDSKPASQK